MATIGRRSEWLENRAAPYVLAPGELGRHGAVLLFKVLGRDIGGLLSFCEFTLDPWESGPVLHRHTSVDEAFYMVAGRLAAQLNQRLQAAAGGFVWVPRAEDRAVGWVRGAAPALRSLSGLL
jgi:quercetin dioxygenase-like cupin family protein